MNERSGGCCIGRPYAAASNGGACAMSAKVERVMLRFRPIAPKPSTCNNNNTSSSSGGGSSVSPANFRRITRGRRKKATTDGGGGAVGVGSKGKRKQPSMSSPEKGRENNNNKRPTTTFKTLSFIPETPDDVILRRRNNCSPSSPSSSSSLSSPQWLSFSNAAGGGSVPSARRVAAVGSLVKVEKVTDAWAVWPNAPPHLDGDTCPCFVTDSCCGYGKVVVSRWANAAYKKMVAGGEKAVAWVVMSEGVVVPSWCVGFTCRVRVVTNNYKEKKNNNYSNKTVPCDVWKMVGGGFAWRLDTAASLSLWVGDS